MTPRTYTNAILVIVGVLILGTLGPVALDQIDQAETAADIAHQQYLAAQAEKRRNRAAAEICGNGAAQWIDEQTLSCALHNGRGKPYLLGTSP